MRARGVQVENRLLVARDLRGVGLAMQHPQLPAVARGRLHGKAPGGKREEIGGQRLRLGKAARDGSRLFGARLNVSAALAATCHDAGSVSVNV